jgi:glycosyltransferase involved in cell wall biosynthesis
LESQDESGSPKACPEKNSMVIVGDMDHHPNVDAVLYFVHEVLPLIKKELPDCILYVVGKNPRAEVRNLGKGNRDVKVVGFVPDVLPYISGAGVFICPIRKTDGIKIKLIEAMHSGKAIVASSAALFGYDVKDGEEILVADSAKEFARKVLLVLRNDDMALRIGRNANNYVRKHHMGAEIEGQILLEYERWSNATPSSQPYPEPLH